MASDTEITKVRIVIRHLLWQIRDVRNDRDAAWKWVNRFANTLQYQELEQDPDQYALAILAEARSFNDQQRRKGQMLGVRKQLAKEGVTRPTQEQLDEKWLEMYGNEESPQDAPNGNAGVDISDAGNGAASKSPTSCDTFTADGDTREDSQAIPDGSAITRNETRAIDALEPSANIYGDTRDDSRGRYAPPSCSPEDGNHYGDAPRREGADVSTTVSRNMRRVPQNEAPAHGFSGGRTAQGTISRSPEAAAQSGKDYDQEPSISTNEARQGLALESQRRAGANAHKCGRTSQSHSATARQRTKNSRCPNSREEFHAFVADNNLHEGLAEEWYAMHEAREWVDRDGKPIKDWRGALYNYCTKTEQKRRTA